MLSGIITVVLMVLFVAMWIWAWRPARKKDFDEAARLALEESERNKADARKRDEVNHPEEGDRQ